MQASNGVYRGARHFLTSARPLQEAHSFQSKARSFDVPRTDEYASLRQWRSRVRKSYEKMQQNQKPQVKLSDEQIRRLNDAGFKWCM